MQDLVGVVGIVRCTQQLGEITSVSIINDQGGDSFLPVGTYRVRVTRAWDDYEIGGRAEGVLLDPDQIEIARLFGTTGFPVRQALPSEQVFVLFVQDDFTPERNSMNESCRNAPPEDHPSYTEGYEFALDWEPGQPLPPVDTSTEAGQQFEAGVEGGMLRNSEHVQRCWGTLNQLDAAAQMAGRKGGDLFGTILRAHHGDKVAAGVEIAKGLMRGDPASFKAGYLKENAVLAVKDLLSLDNDQTSQVRTQLPDDE